MNTLKRPFNRQLNQAMSCWLLVAGKKQYEEKRMNVYLLLSGEKTQ
jgi:hypothetical protein